MKRIEPKAGQESVWDYPRPPRLEACPSTAIKVEVFGKEIVNSTACYRVLETSHPPVYYIPVSEIKGVTLAENVHQSWCEWKGKAGYVDLVSDGQLIENAGWFYADPHPRFADLKRAIAFYPSKMDACFVDDERVTPQQGDFYGGWITARVVGPFKGGPGTRGW